MRVPGKLQVYGILRDDVGVIRFMHEHNDSLVAGHALQRLRNISMVAEHVIQAGQPKSRPIALDGLRLVGEHMNVVGLQRLRHKLRIGVVVVISDDPPTNRMGP